MAASDSSEAADGRAVGPVLYVSLLVAAALGVFVYDLRVNGIFACSPAGYAPGTYLAYCNSAGYSDYDHGAFWFGLEPEAADAARRADVLFLGTSRVQFAFSSDVTRDWFAGLDASFYLLGFAYSENVTFTGPLLARLGPKPRVYVVNTDRFFRTHETPPTAEIFHGDAPLGRHRRKRLWQGPHRLLCEAIAFVCGDAAGFFRNVEHGVWTFQGSDGLEPSGISWAARRGEDELAELAAVAAEFIDGLGVARRCVLLTVAPTDATPREDAAAIADALGLELFAPRVEGLRTFDSSHLDRPSAEAWSAEFFAAAGKRIRSCLDEPAQTVERAVGPSRASVRRR